MEAPETVHAQEPIPATPHAIEVTDEIVASGVEVARIGTERHATAVGEGDRRAQPSHLLEGAAECRALAGGRFEQHPYPPRHGVEARGVRKGVPGKARVPIIEEVAWMGHDASIPSARQRSSSATNAAMLFTRSSSSGDARLMR